MICEAIFYNAFYCLDMIRKVRDWTVVGDLRSPPKVVFSRSGEMTGSLRMGWN